MDIRPPLTTGSCTSRPGRSARARDRSLYLLGLPPIYLFVGAGLASLPYFVAFASWIALTWSAFALTLRRIIGHQLGLILAAAFPATWFNVAIGQNGCLTAALMGWTLLLLDSQPVLAGLCLGALTYKPQFGLLFPLVLGIAG